MFSAVLELAKCLCDLLAWMMDLLQVRLGRELVISPRRVWRRLAQTLFAKGRPGDLLFIFWANEPLAQARGISPKRDPAVVPISCFEPSPRRRGTRLSETVSPERGPSAWARPFSLSEGLSETVCGLVAWLPLDEW